MAGLWSWLFGGDTQSCCYVGHWCDTPLKFSNRIETPLGSKVSKVTVCVDIWYTVADDQLVISKVQLSRGGALGDTRVNVATMKGEAFFVGRLCSDDILKHAVESDLESDPGLRKRMLAKWRGEHAAK